MNIFEVNNKENWPKSVNFAQSFEWGEIARAEGLKVDRLSFQDGEKPLVAQIIYKTLPFGWRYAWCPKWPVSVISTEAVGVVERSLEVKTLRDSSTALRSAQNDNTRVYEVLADYLKKKKCIFLRCEPEQSLDGVKMIKTKDVNPRVTVVLDLNGSEDEILAGMKKNTRYSIRFAEKQNLVIKNKKNLEIFWDLLQTTAARDKFTTHAKDHYKNILASSSVWQLTAFKDDKSIASAIFISSGDTITYLFAASDYEQHQLLAPYLIQWEAIKAAKKMGFKYYDFFGIAPEEKNQKSKNRLRTGNCKNQNLEETYLYSAKHPYAGITKFKLGFGGKIQLSPGTFDLMLDQKKYWIYKILRFVYGIRKIGK